MQYIITIVKLSAVMLAAISVGKWFLAEVKTAKRNNAPWYAPYATLPGILVIVLVIVVPLILWFLQKTG